MAKAGRPVYKGERCHHIVAETAEKAKEARDKLKKLGVDVNDARNSVALPQKFHESLHMGEYFNAINEASRNWKTKEDAIAGLQGIAEELAKLARQLE